jgi:membrane associated rhomboid family serine protease
MKKYKKKYLKKKYLKEYIDMASTISVVTALTTVYTVAQYGWWSYQYIYRPLFSTPAVAPIQVVIPLNAWRDKKQKSITIDHSDLEDLKSELIREIRIHENHFQLEKNKPTKSIVIKRRNSV